ncbi:MAG: GatB/YqeY domain-containing protein [Chitinophagales bacterium]
MNFEKQINNDIKTAMRAKDKDTLRSLRAIKSGILLAKTADGGSDELSEAAVIKMLAKMVKQRKDAAAIFEQQNRADLAAKEMVEVNVIQKYLPEQLDEATIKAKIAEIIAQTGASSMRDMGKVMGMANKAMAGKAEGKLIANIVKQLLQS